ERRWYVEQSVRCGPGELAGVEEPDHAVLPVVAGCAPDVAAPKPGHRLAEPFAADLRDLVQRYVQQNVQFGPQRGDEARGLGLHAPALRTNRVQLAEHLVQLDEVAHVGMSLGPPRLRSVGQFLDPMQDAHGQRLTAFGTLAAGVAGALRRP